ncbi:glycosyltransferase [Algoriphagus formosus]|uniref:glycosyltransferase n=1 Tax=Algoriphagus formosus TaxID=2007308 RepID=UPI003F710922
MKIRILHCIETIASGGVEQVRLTLVRGLPKDRFEHKIICTWKGGPIAEALEAEGLELIPIGSFKHPLQWSKHKQVLKVIREFKPHIIHGAIFEGMSMAAIGGKLGKVPITILEETSFPQSRSQKAIYLQQLFVKVADKVIGIAPTVISYLSDQVKIPQSKLRLINNGVNSPREVSPSELEELRLELGIKNDDLIIGSAGRFYNEVKRFTDILEAIHQLPISNIKFLLLGQGPDQGLILSKAKERELEEQLILPGYQTDTAPFYELMDVFCIASAHEGFGLVAAEAMLHGLPVIATKVGGLQDIVLDQETGYLVPPLSPESLAEKIQLLIDQPELRQEMGKKGKQRSLEHFSAERYCHEVENLYLELLGKKGIEIRE